MDRIIGGEMKKYLIMCALILSHSIVYGQTIKFANPYDDKATKEYYEVIEDKGVDKDGLSISEKITWTEVTKEADATTEHNKLSNKTSLSGKKYEARYHIHRHGANGNNRPCITKIIEIKK